MENGGRGEEKDGNRKKRIGVEEEAGRGGGRKLVEGGGGRKLVEGGGEE